MTVTAAFLVPLPRPVRELICFPLSKVGILNPKWFLESDFEYLFSSDTFAHAAIRTALAAAATFLVPHLSASFLGLAALGGVLLSSRITLLVAGGMMLKAGVVALQASIAVPTALAIGNGVSLIVLGMLVWGQYDVRHKYSLTNKFDILDRYLVCPIAHRIVPKKQALSLKAV